MSKCLYHSIRKYLLSPYHGPDALDGVVNKEDNIHFLTKLMLVQRRWKIMGTNKKPPDRTQCYEEN